MGIYSIIDSRAWNSLKLVTEEFKEYTSVERKEINKMELEVEKFGLKKMYSSYKIINKWMGRIYIFKWHCIIDDQKTTNNVSIKLQYSGKFFGTKEPMFYSKSGNPLVSLLNKNNKIMDICRNIDFEKLELSYCKEDKAWNIEIWPNYGDFVWMLIPPVRYFRKPNSEEISKTMQLILSIRYVLQEGVLEK